MASAERKISRVSRGTSTVEAPLAGREEEAARLRAEVAALQDEIRWLTGEDDDGDRGLLSPGWLSRGWARGSRRMAGVGVGGFGSGPYVRPRCGAPAPRRSPAGGPHKNPPGLPRASAPRPSPPPPTCRSARPPRRAASLASPPAPAGPGPPTPTAPPPPRRR